MRAVPRANASAIAVEETSSNTRVTIGQPAAVEHLTARRGERSMGLPEALV